VTWRTVSGGEMLPAERAPGLVTVSLGKFLPAAKNNKAPMRQTATTSAIIKSFRFDLKKEASSGVDPFGVMEICRPQTGQISRPSRIIC